MREKLKTLSGLRQEIVVLREERKKLEDSLFRPKKMIRASLSFIPGYCGKEDCRCKRGWPHGPYPYLSERYQGRTRLTYVKKKDLIKVKKEVAEYVRIQKGLAHLRKINSEIRFLLETIRDLNLRTVDEIRGRQ
jgi:hypothetical protein